MTWLLTNPEQTFTSLCLNQTRSGNFHISERRNLTKLHVLVWYVYLRRQQEMGLMQKPRRLFVFKHCQSNTQMSGGFFCFVFLFCFCLGFFLEGGGHAQKPMKIQWKQLHKALRSVQFLASSGISFYFEILSYLACVEKTVRLAFKNSVKLGKKLASDFSSLWYASGDPFPVDALHVN